MADRGTVTTDVRLGRRRWFGTDGVRGVVGEALTPELVEQLGRAATLWSGRGRVLVGRDTRGSGPALEAALTRGIVDAGGTAVLGGILPTPAVALLSQDLGLVVSASHNPPEYNGVKVFDREGHKLTDADELEIEALVGAPGPGGGSVEHAERGRPASDHLSPHELQIALQVAGGATNAEAAAALFVTRKTIEFHLRNVYRKLGIRSRTELAALMASQRSIRPRQVERPDIAPSAPSLDS